MQETSGNAGSTVGLGRSPGEGNGSLLQYSCLGNAMDRGAWRAAVRGVTESQTRLSDLVQHCEAISIALLASLASTEEPLSFTEGMLHIMRDSLHLTLI